jgi:hypothetical protein
VREVSPECHSVSLSVSPTLLRVFAFFRFRSHQSQPTPKVENLAAAALLWCDVKSLTIETYVHKNRAHNKTTHPPPKREHQTTHSKPTPPNPYTQPTYATHSHMHSTGTASYHTPPPRNTIRRPLTNTSPAATASRTTPSDRLQRRNVPSQPRDAKPPPSIRELADKRRAADAQEDDLTITSYANGCCICWISDHHAPIECAVTCNIS